MSTLDSMPLIAIFVPSSNTGGAEHYIKNILPLVKKSGFKPVLILPKNQKIIDFYADTQVESLVDNISWSADEGDMEVSNSYLDKLTRQHQAATRILKLLKPDCVFNNLPWVDFGLGISLACHDFQLPCINLIHLCPWRVELNSLTKRLFQELSAANSLFFTVSKDNRIQLSLSTGIELNSIQVFYNSREIEHEYAELSTNEYRLNRLELLDELSLPLNSFISVSVGRFSHQKNFLDILTAFAAVQQKLPHYYHLFLGEGKLKASYQKMTEGLGIAKKMKFLGYRQDVQRFLALSDLFISTSLYEGLALSILEAAQFSCPIVAADSSSAREIISSPDLGLLYNPGHYYLLQKHLEFAYYNPEVMAQKAINLKARCQKVFSAQKFAADLKGILQISLGRSREFIYPSVSISFDLKTEKLKPNCSFNVLNYQYRGLPKSLIPPEKILPFPLKDYGHRKLAQRHEQYLHCLCKLGKQLAHLKTILCFGEFNASFFRCYYLEENHLLVTLSPQEASVTLGIYLIDRTYWGQEIEPDCIAKFTTLENPLDILKIELELNTQHFYTSKKQLSACFKLSNEDTLSMNLKMIDNAFRPNGYYQLENNGRGKKVKLRSMSKSA